MAAREQQARAVPGEGSRLLWATSMLRTCATAPSPVSHAAEGEPGSRSVAPEPTAALTGASFPMMDHSVHVNVLVELCSRYRPEEWFVSS